jgi:hypothetical protein
MIKKLNTFSFNEFSEMEEKNLSGKFTARIASFGDRTKINVRKAQLLGGMYCVVDDDGNPTGRGVDAVTEYHAYMQAHLETCLVQKPDWMMFDGDNALADDAIISKVFREVMRFENSFRTRGRSAAEGEGESAQGGEGASAAQPAQANAGNRPAKVVDGQVQAALEP